MELPANLLDRYTTTPQQGAPRNERDEVLQAVLDRLNESRVKGGFRKVSHARLRKIFEGKSAHQIYMAHRACEGADSYGGLFWHLAKTGKL